MGFRKNPRVNQQMDTSLHNMYELGTFFQIGRQFFNQRPAHIPTDCLYIFVHRPMTQERERSGPVHDTSIQPSINRTCRVRWWSSFARGVIESNSISSAVVSSSIIVGDSRQAIQNLQNDAI